ncbi:MAG: hypothetical protein LUF32_05565 [Clostridiales bacterium]|nr:hypothetical protein [Clostridiales bacterium]
MTEVMSDVLQGMRTFLPVCIVFIVVCLLAMKINLKKEYRSRQILMPVIALAYGIAVAVIIVVSGNAVLSLMNRFLELLRTLHLSPGTLEAFLLNAANGMENAMLAGLLTKLAAIIDRLIDFIRNLNPLVLLYWVENFGFLGLFMLLKGILIRVMKKVMSESRPVIEMLQSPFYVRYEDSNLSYLRKNCCQARTFLKVLHFTAVFGLSLLALLSCGLCRADVLQQPLSPVVAIILIGEVAYILGGRTKQEAGEDLEGEDERARHQVSYFLMKEVLRKLFPDKLGAESTTVNNGLVNFRTNREVLGELEDDDSAMIEIYGHFLAHRHAMGMKLDHKYVSAGKEMLEGKSILFNNPFYYDLIPYLSYPMNRTLLKHKKVLIVLGRHGNEKEIEAWCREGLNTVNNTPTLWRVGVMDREYLNDDERPDVGILTRSMVHDIRLHEANAEFLAEVGMMILIEPSRLLATAQIGLNSLVRCCSTGDRKPVFCSIDKNCDGLLDALSHVLMVSLTEVSATDHHQGISSYMCWDADSDHLQHRMLPNLSRYLGFGTELSVSALKNQISETFWYGGEAFPVTDVGWIAGQYYYDLLEYASLPTEQETLKAKFHVSPEMWGARKQEIQYMTVEDESFNVFEMKRDFSTRTTREGFINILSPEYLMKDYMTANNSIFSADPKAIPYVVADYAHTARNVVLRLCLRMAVGMVWESELRQELQLIDAPVIDLSASLWHEIRRTRAFGSGCEGDLLTCTDQGIEYIFSESVIRTKRKYNIHTGKMESCFYLEDPVFIRLYVDTLKNVEYVAEDEQGEDQYLGSEVLGQIYQRHLPGQFFTIAGKYYEMLRVNTAGKVILRRAADHITGRECYRQIRMYHLENVRESQQMGDVRKRDGLQIIICYADIAVETPAYWKMDRYNDFRTARRVDVNGIPERIYYNKRLLKIGFENGTHPVTPEICRTLTVLMNEIFVTLFAENQGFIAAIMPGEQEIPITCQVEGCPEENCIYIIEDSQLDIGLLEAAQRNLDRIFSILCDYLDWELEAVKNSENPPAEPERTVTELPEPSDEEPAGKKKRGPFGRRRGRSGRRKNRKKKDGQKGGRTPETEETAGTAETVEPAEPAETPEAEEPAELTGAGEAAEATGTTETEETAAGTDEAAETAGLAEAEETEETTGTAEEAGSETAADIEKTAAESTEETAGKESVSGENAENDAEDNTVIQMSFSFSGSEIRLSADSPETGSGTEDGQNSAGSTDGGTGSAETAEAGTGVADHAVTEPESGSADGAGTEPGDDKGTDFEFEGEQATVVKLLSLIPQRKPYHERRYLLYGGEQMPEGILPSETLEFLIAHGYGSSELKQAREGKILSRLMEEGFEPNLEGRHYCDFCGAALTGTEYEVLQDGRERCMACGRTAIKTEAEFVELYKTVKNSMQSYYGIRLNVPVKVRMVNSKRLHRALGRTFVPTGNADGRVLGVAISSRDGYSLLVENGSPRISSAMTMAHELTHIWQYLNWDRKEILNKYGRNNELLIYEGMAKWSEIQYAYLIGEMASARREEIITRHREDEYGQGFLVYESRYPLSEDTTLEGETPFMNNPPL